MSVYENYLEVEKKVQEACKRAGRNREEVTLIAVSKTKPVSMIEELLPHGVVDFGENKVQELTAKYEVLPKDLNWHLIGHLQRNKVKYIIDKACLIHSVDSIRLAETISQEAVKKNVTASILVEVNVAEEESKFGVTSEETEKLVEEISKLPNISSSSWDISLVRAVRMCRTTLFSESLSAAAVLTSDKSVYF